MEPKPLYLAKNFETLKKEYAIYKPEENENGKTDQSLLTSLDRMFDVANECVKQGDEEKAYCLYMRYMDLYVILCEKFKTHQSAGKQWAIRKKRIEQALKYAKLLTIKLENRYAELERENEINTKTEEDNLSYANINFNERQSDVKTDRSSVQPLKTSLYCMNADTNSPLSTQSTCSNGAMCSTVAPPMPPRIQPVQFIRPNDLYRMKDNDNPHTVLVIDTRSRARFHLSHVSGESTINLPEDVVHDRGLSIETLIGVLNYEEAEIFAKRHKYNHVVFVHTDSTPMTWTALDNPTAIIMDILITKDHTIEAIKVAPEVLDGGFRRWFNLYPTLCTNSSGYLGVNQNHYATGTSIDYPSLPDRRMDAILSYQLHMPDDVSSSSEVTTLYPSIPTFTYIAQDDWSVKNVGECVPADDHVHQLAAPPINRTSKPSERENDLAVLPSRPITAKPQLSSPPPLPTRLSKNNETASSLPPQRLSNQSLSQHDLTLKGKKGHGLTGLKNMGNTCYLNSILQCLSNTMPFSVYFIDQRYKKDINQSNPLGMKGQLADEFGVLLRAMWSGKYSHISPTAMKSVISKFAPRFAGQEQHDSQELLAFLMDGLHEDLNRARDRRYIEDDYEGLPDPRAAMQAWANYKRRNDSVIVDLFQGQFRNRLQCLTCRHTSTTFNAFMYLSLPIPSTKHRPTITDCIDLFVKEEKVSGNDQWYCTKCKTHRDAIKKIDIWRVPSILFVHFKRFSSDSTGSKRQKLDMFVDFPVRDLDLDIYSMGTKIGRKYQLEGVSNHWGKMGSGHYTSYCKNVFDSQWYHFDDSVVSKISQDKIK
eukprot:Ihof_evm6s28 gene=Ihof_evmTU6s28